METIYALLITMIVLYGSIFQAFALSYQRELKKLNQRPVLDYSVNELLELDYEQLKKDLNIS